MLVVYQISEIVKKKIGKWWYFYSFSAILGDEGMRPCYLGSGRIWMAPWID